MTMFRASILPFFFFLFAAGILLPASSILGVLSSSYSLLSHEYESLAADSSHLQCLHISVLFAYVFSYALRQALVTSQSTSPFANPSVTN